jgi:hypothetical protein
MRGEDVKKVILEKETASWQAWVGDRVSIPAAQQLLAPDYIDIDASGSLWSASEMIEQMKDCGISSFKFRNLQTRVLASHVVATIYYVDVNAHCGAQQISEQVLASSLWVKHGRKWLTELHTETMVPAKR